MRVVVTGGGTGGHIYPALAVADALKRLDSAIELHYIGGVTGPETEIVPKQGIPFLAVKSRKLRKIVSISTLGVMWSLLMGYREAALFLKRFRPDVVISTGGYVAAATALAAARQKIPLVTQACDAVPGRTNLWLAKYATRICVWFDDTKRFFPAGKAVSTGVPLRRGIVSTKTPAEARAALRLHSDLFTVLVMGGSQGARKLNDIVIDLAPDLPSAVQVLHQVGPRNIQTVKERLEGCHDVKVPYEARAYLEGEEVPLAYRAADAVICRCGVSTLAEVTANGVPALMVPLPTAYADHQTANAREVERAGGGILLPEATLTPTKLAQAVTDLVTDAGLRERMRESGRSLGRPDAADRIAQIAFALGMGDDV